MRSTSPQAAVERALGRCKISADYINRNIWRPPGRSYDGLARALPTKWTKRTPQKPHADAGGSQEDTTGWYNSSDVKERYMYAMMVKRRTNGHIRGRGVYGGDCHMCRHGRADRESNCSGAARGGPESSCSRCRLSRHPLNLAGAVLNNQQQAHLKSEVSGQP